MLLLVFRRHPLDISLIWFISSSHPKGDAGIANTNVENKCFERGVFGGIHRTQVSEQVVEGCGLGRNNEWYNMSPFAYKNTEKADFKKIEKWRSLWWLILVTSLQKVSSSKYSHER